MTSRPEHVIAKELDAMRKPSWREQFENQFKWGKWPKGHPLEGKRVRIRISTGEPVGFQQYAKEYKAAVKAQGLKIRQGKHIDDAGLRIAGPGAGRGRIRLYKDPKGYYVPHPEHGRPMTVEEFKAFETYDKNKAQEARDKADLEAAKEDYKDATVDKMDAEQTRRSLSLYNRRELSAKNNKGVSLKDGEIGYWGGANGKTWIPMGTERDIQNGIDEINSIREDSKNSGDGSGVFGTTEKTKEFEQKNKGKSTVFTRHYQTGEQLGVMTRNQRRAYEKEAGYGTANVKTFEGEMQKYGLTADDPRRETKYTSSRWRAEHNYME